MKEWYETNRLVEKGLCGLDWDNTTDGDWIILSPLLIGNARDLWIFAGQIAPSPFYSWIVKEDLKGSNANNAEPREEFSNFYSHLLMHILFPSDAQSDPVLVNEVEHFVFRLSVCQYGPLFVEETDLKNRNEDLHFGKLSVAQPLNLRALLSKVCGVRVLMVLNGM